MKLKMYQVDAFASQVFQGNPAAVLILDAFLDDDLMQSIAAENNLSETAFCVARPDGEFDLRWFTPSTEIEFCGHATIATAHILKAELGLTPPFKFHTQIGALSVRANADDYILNAPILPARSIDITEPMKAAFPMPLRAAFTAGPNLYVVARDATRIEPFKPDFSKILPLSGHGVGLTAKGGGPYDFVSRLFFPAEGIDEDPVTGSAHAALASYWGGVLGKRAMLARQLSARGGDLKLRLSSDRVDIAGPAVTFMRGQIFVTL